MFTQKGLENFPEPGTRKYYEQELARYEAWFKEPNVKTEYIQLRIDTQKECIRLLDSGKPQEEVWAFNLNQQDL